MIAWVEEVDRVLSAGGLWLRHEVTATPHALCWTSEHSKANVAAAKIHAKRIGQPLGVNTVAVYVGVTLDEARDKVLKAHLDKRAA